MNSRTYEYILAIAEYKNLSVAARYLHISQPALSKFLASQEEEFGTPLFFSYRKKLFPTPAGQVLIKSAQKIMHIKTLTYQQIQNHIEQKSQELTVGASSYSGSIHISPIIADMYEHFPQISVNIKEGTSGELWKQLSNGQLDFSILPCPVGSDIPFPFYQFAKIELYAIVPAFHKLYIRSNSDDDIPWIELAELQHIPFILPDHTISYRPYLISFFEEAGFAPTIIYNSKNPFTVKTLVEKGLGASFISSNFLSQIDRQKCQIFHLKHSPLLNYILALRTDLQLGDAEYYFIRRFLQLELKNHTQNFYPNEATIHILNSEGDE